MTVRTMIVSTSTPTPTMRPSWPSTISGSMPSAANTPARTMPALVMTPPVWATASIMPWRPPWSTDSFFARWARKIE